MIDHTGRHLGHPDRDHTHGSGVPRDARLRHTWATLALRASVHPKVVQERLGHSNIGVTLSIYSHVSAGMQRDAAETVAAMIFGV